MHNEREFLIEQILAQQQEPSFGWPGRDVNCPDVTLLMADALDEAAADEKRLVDEHCAGCDGCRTLREVYRESFRDDPDISEPLIEGSLLERMAEHREFKPKRPPWPWGQPTPHTGDQTSGEWTDLARSGQHDKLGEQLRPWLPFLLRRWGLEESTAEAFLAYVKAQLPAMKGRRFREALPVWLAAFAGEHGGTAPPTPWTSEEPSPFFAQAAATLALQRPAENEAPWAVEFRDFALRRGVRSAQELGALTPPESIAAEPVFEDYRWDLVNEVEKTARAGVELMETVL